MRKWLIGCGVVALLVCGGACVWVGLLFREPKIEIPPREYPPNNAYEAHQRIGFQIARMREQDRQFQAIEDKVPRQNLSPTERRYYLERVQPYLNEYRKHLNKPSVVIMEYGMQARFPEFASFRTIARAESFLIREDLRYRRETSAVERFDSLLRFSNQIRNEGNLMHYLVGTAIISMGSQPFLETSLQSQGALSAMVRTAQRYEKERVPIYRAIRNERNFILAGYKEIATNKVSLAELMGKEGAESQAGARSNLPGKVLVNLALPEFHRYMDALESQLQLPHWERKRETLPNLRNPLNQILLPVFSEGMGETEVIEQARIRLLGVASAVRLHRIRTGRYPKSLEELNLGDLAIDPCSGQPFVYRTDPKKGFMLYSIGPDGLDDGGAFVYGGARPSQGDIVPTYRPLPANLREIPVEQRPLHPPVWLR